MGCYDAIRTDKGLEENGIWLDYGPFRLLCARSGGANRKFAKRLEAKTRPYQRALKNETIDPDVVDRLMRELFAETVILDWNVKDDKGQWVRGIELPDGSVGSVTPENVAAVLADIPDVWTDIQNEAQKAANYRRAVQDANSGN